MKCRILSTPTWHFRQGFKWLQQIIDQRSLRGLKDSPYLHLGLETLGGCWESSCIDLLQRVAAVEARCKTQHSLFVFPCCPMLTAALKVIFVQHFGFIRGVTRRAWVSWLHGEPAGVESRAEHEVSAGLVCLAAASLAGILGFMLLESLGA